MRERFALAKLAEEDALIDLLKVARVTFVEGLLLHAFRTSTDKVGLRASVQKHMALLGPYASKADIVRAILTRAEAAMKFKVNV